MIVIPAMDIIDGCVVRLEQGDYQRKTIYSKEPLSIAQNFIDAGVKRLHLVDLSGAKAAKPVHAKLFAEIKKKTGAIIEAGGGIRTLEQVDALFDAGLNVEEDFIMIGSLPFLNRAEFLKIKQKYGKAILLTVDVWQRAIKISGWQEDSKQSLLPFIQEMQGVQQHNFLVTQIKKDGMLSGPDIDLYVELTEHYGGCQFIASGGVSKIDDFISLEKIKGLTGAILGKAFYEGHVTLQQLADFISR